MTLFPQTGPDKPQKLNAWLPLLACFFAATVAAVVTCPIPAARRFNPFQIVIWSIAYPAVVFAAAAIIGWTGFAVSKLQGIDVVAVALRFAATSMFLAPLVIFVSAGYFWSVAAAGAFAIMAAKLLRRFERTAIGRHSSILEEPSSKRNMFPVLSPELPFDGNLRVFAAAVSVQIGLIAAVSDLVSAAAFFVGAACFLVAWWSAATDAPRRSVAFRRSETRVLESILPAIFLTFFGLLPYAGMAKSRPAAETKEAEQTSKSSITRSADELYSGIILIPEARKHVTIVPPLPNLRRDIFRQGDRNPLAFPFAGEYWFLSWPHKRPPKNSMVARGTPGEFKFTSQDRSPLSMQARQSLGAPIDMRCCSRIDLAVISSDPMPATISLEVILIDSSKPDKAAQSLGEAELSSSLPAVGSDVVTLKETLRFTLPPQPLIQRFDEIRIVFHLRPPRMNRSANIAVDRFYLVPRGI